MDSECIRILSNIMGCPAVKEVDKVSNDFVGLAAASGERQSGRTAPRVGDLLRFGVEPDVTCHTSNDYEIDHAHYGDNAASVGCV